jgi:hypothetical protein
MKRSYSAAFDETLGLDDDFEILEEKYPGSGGSSGRSNLQAELAKQMQSVDTPAPVVSVTDGKSCPVCPRPPKSKKRKYCLPHDKAYENIARFSMKGCADGTDTEESAAFKKIFGFGRTPGDEVMQARVLEDYLEKFPDGKLNRGPRGNLPLVTYTQSQGHRESIDSVGQCPRMDFEAFSVHMETCRKWKMARALQEWGILKDDTTVGRDENGPKGQSLRLSIPSWMAVTDFDEHRFGSFQEKRVDTSLKPKAMAPEEVVKLVADCGRGFGRLDKSDRDDARQAAQTPAIMSINGGLISASELLKEAAAQVASTDDGDEPTTPASGKKTPAPLEDGHLGLAARKRGVSDIGTARQNARSSATEILSKDDAKMWKSIEATMAELHKFNTDPTRSTANHESLDIFSEMVDRLSVALLYMGCEFAKGPDGSVDYSVKRGVPISAPALSAPQLELPSTESDTALVVVASDVAPSNVVLAPPLRLKQKSNTPAKPVVAGVVPSVALATAVVDVATKVSDAAATPLVAAVAPSLEAATAVVAVAADTAVVAEDFDCGQHHTKLMRDALSRLPLFPLEAPDEFLSRCELKTFPFRIKAATSHADIEELVAIVDNNVVQTSQLMDALESTRKGLKRELVKMAKGKKTKETAQRAKEEEDRKKLQAVAELDLKKRLLVQKNKNTWEVDWNAAAHSKIDNITGEASWDAFASDVSQSFDLPLILTGWQPLETAFKSELDENGSPVVPDIKKTLDSWASKFPTSKSGETANKSTAPALQKHKGIENMNPIWSKLLPNDKIIASTMPAFVQLTSHPWFFGYCDTHFQHAFENDFLGSVRIQVHGALHVVAVPAAGLAHALSLTTSPTRLDQMKEFLRTITQEQAVMLHTKSCQVLHGVVNADKGPVVFIVPPGYLVCQRALNDSIVFGLRMNFLAKGAVAAANLAACRLLEDEQLGTFIHLVEVAL